MNVMYDVIIIGAGPCGCVAARTLSKNGLKVLLLEKCKLPRYKSCSGILIEKSIRFIERYLGCSVPTSATCTPAYNHGMIFTDDIGREYRFTSSGLNIWRDKFDLWLATLAQESGAEVKDDSVVTSVREENDKISVFVNGEVLQARYAIDCSGVVGIGEKARHNVVTYQTYNRGTIDLDPHYFYAYLQPDLSGYDAWFNVKDDMLVLGVASVEYQDVNRYFEAFEVYMREKHGLCVSK